MKWTEEEKAIIAENWGKGLSPKALEEILPGKSFGAMQAFALRNKMGGNRLSLWTPAEDVILKEYWPTRKPLAEWLHLLPGRTKLGTYRRARTLNLGVRQKPYVSALWSDIEKLLADRKPRSIKQLVEETGWSNWWIRAQIRRRIGEEIYIARWIPKAKNGTQPEALFMLGKKPNAAKPKPLPGKEVWHRYTDRMKKERPEDFKKMMEKKKIKQKVRSGKPIVTQADPAAVWMFNALPKAA